MQEQGILRRRRGRKVHLRSVRLRRNGVCPRAALCCSGGLRGLGANRKASPPSPEGPEGDTVPINCSNPQSHPMAFGGCVLHGSCQCYGAGFVGRIWGLSAAPGQPSLRGVTVVAMPPGIWRMVCQPRPGDRVSAARRPTRLPFRPSRLCWLCAGWRRCPRLNGRIPAGSGVARTRFRGRRSRHLPRRPKKPCELRLPAIGGATPDS